MKIFLYFCPEIDSWVRYNLTMPEYKKTSTNIKFDHWKCIRISEKAHLRSDFRKKKILEWGSNPRSYYIFRAEIEKYYVRFSVQMKTAKSPFEIIWPLEDASSTMVEIEGITAISSIKGPLKFFLGNCTEVNHVCPRRQCWLLWHWP